MAASACRAAASGQAGRVARASTGSVARQRRARVEGDGAATLKDDRAGAVSCGEFARTIRSRVARRRASSAPPSRSTAPDPPVARSDLVDDRPLDMRGTERVRRAAPRRRRGPPRRALRDRHRSHGCDVARRHHRQALGFLPLGAARSPRRGRARAARRAARRTIAAAASDASREAPRQSAARAIACPASCWQYRNARSPYFHASRQWIDVSATRNPGARAR